ncbi:ankyrin repeat domain-containing protein 26-like isoform X3 [Mobula hypostoma]|uniref:ankyrin repeat domain-containing protein 26-like isoform X3 n=1 Tax=Mobula hypostoma TaxID=723540 RepID=UPI002FC38DFD
MRILQIAKRKEKPSFKTCDTSSEIRVGYELKEKDLGKLHKAASAGDLNRLRQLIKKKDVNQLDKQNRAPLHLACANGHADVVALLVENKSNLNICDNENRSPLMKAVQCEQERCVVILLSHDADPNLVDINVYTALHLAVLIPNITLATHLLEYGAHLDARDKNGYTPLLLAATRNHQKMAKCLLKKGADVNAKDKTGRTTLMIAASNGQTNLVKLLLRHGTDASLKDDNGWTADDYALRNGQHACSHLITEHHTKKRHRSSRFKSGAMKEMPSRSDHSAEVNLGFGEPAMNKEIDTEYQESPKLKSRTRRSVKVIGDNSLTEPFSGESKSAVNSWLSSDEEDNVPCSSKTIQKFNLTNLLNSSQRYKENMIDDISLTEPFSGESKSAVDAWLSSDEEDNVPCSSKGMFFEEEEAQPLKACSKRNNLGSNEEEYENQHNQERPIKEDLLSFMNVLSAFEDSSASEISVDEEKMKQEKEKWITAEMLLEKSCEHLQRKESQYCEEIQAKHKFEQMLRNLEIERGTVMINVKKLSEENKELQIQLNQEKAKCEEILNRHLHNQQKIAEENNTTVQEIEPLAQCDNHHNEEALMEHNCTLQQEVTVLKRELKYLCEHHQEEREKYMEQIETLKVELEDTKKGLRSSQNNLTQTNLQDNSQLNAMKSEVLLLTSKLETQRTDQQNEKESILSRLNATIQELERSQKANCEFRQILQRECDEWVHLDEKRNNEISNLRAISKEMSHKLTKEERKANDLDKKLHHAKLSLAEKNSMLESVQKELKQFQEHVTDPEQTNKVEKGQLSKYEVSLVSLQERLAQAHSEITLLRQQLKDAQNKVIMKEKVVTDVHDKFNNTLAKLQKDSEQRISLLEKRNEELLNKNMEQSKYENEIGVKEVLFRQLQQDLADSLKKLAMSEASLEVVTRSRNEIEGEKNHLQQQLYRLKIKLQENKNKNMQSKRKIQQLENALKEKEYEIAASQKIQEAFSTSSQRNETKNHLKDQIQRMRTLLKTTKKKLKQNEVRLINSHINGNEEPDHEQNETADAVSTLKRKIHELSHQLEGGSAKCKHLESTNEEQIKAMHFLQKSHDHLEQR